MDELVKLSVAGISQCSSLVAFILVSHSFPSPLQYPSKNGFSALANKMPRLPIMRVPVGPKVGTYDPDPWILRAGNTFNKFVVPEQKWLSPGWVLCYICRTAISFTGHRSSFSPSTYTVHNKYPAYKVETRFGSNRIIWPAVAVMCGPKSEAVCTICEQQPKGDYFRNFGVDKDMCRKCMHAELSAIRDCKLSVIVRFRRTCLLRKFVPVRYCGFFHGHDGTTAHIELISRHELRQKTRIENYLYRFETKVGYETFLKRCFIPLPEDTHDLKLR